MKLLSTQNLLAVLAVADIALHAGRKPVSATSLAARHQLPARYLEPVLQELVRLEILKGVRGPRGGYRLAREAGAITVGEVIRVSAALSANNGREIGAASALLRDVVAPRLEQKIEGFFASLSEITIADLCAGTERLSESQAADAVRIA
jgi:Rrf2 family transcriptional regulator, iron-sulfur cluster assembly transcription factor